MTTGIRQPDQSRSIHRWLVSALVASALILACPAAGRAQDRVAPRDRPAVTVGGTTLSMGYLVKRMRKSGFLPLVQLEALAEELIVAQGATSQPFSFDVTADEIDARFRMLAASPDGPLPDDAFRAWYLDQVNGSGMSEGEFRGVMRNRLLAEKVRAKLAESVPKTAPQVRILLASGPSEAAVQAFSRLLLRGDSFSVALAAPSVAGTGVTGGEIGWMPCEALSAAMCETVFALQPGWPSEPIKMADRRWAVVVVAERDEHRMVGPKVTAALEDKLFDAWLTLQKEQNPPSYGDPRLGWTSTMNSWAHAQAGLERLDAR